MIKSAQGEVAYCAGVGEDLALENELAAHVTVVSLDPTPRSIEYVAKNPYGIKNKSFFSFQPYGLWSSDAELEFVAPDNPDHVSHTIKENSDGSNSFSAQCLSVKTCMEKFGHHKLFLLKMNIEGAEYEVLKSLVRDRIFPQVIMLTYEGDWAFVRALFWNRKLQKLGYQVLGVRGWAVTYVFR